jgi:hypothetical protein
MNPERDAGSRTVMDILLRRKGDPAADAVAIQGKTGRLITCHMRADFAPFPTKWKIGNLPPEGVRGSLEAWHPRSRRR